MAYKIVFTATDGMKHERKAMQIWTVKGDNAYLITYKAEPAGRFQSFERCGHSFGVKKSRLVSYSNCTLLLYTVIITSILPYIRK